MKKMTLDLDDLRVDSFETGADQSASGTVFGYTTTDISSNVAGATCMSCYGGCGESGGPTCDPDPEKCEYKQE